MNLEQFLQNFNHAPLSEEEVADVIVNADNEFDYCKLYNNAKMFLWAREEFLNELDNVGFRFG